MAIKEHISLRTDYRPALSMHYNNRGIKIEPVFAFQASAEIIFIIQKYCLLFSLHCVTGGPTIVVWMLLF